MTPDEESRIRADEREKERERCAAEIEEMKWMGLAPPTRIAADLRSGTSDTDYVCVRREELEALAVASKPFFDEEEQWHEMGGTRILSHATKLNVGELRALCARLRSLLKEKGGENGV